MIEASPQGSRISAFAAMGPGEALQPYAFAKRALAAVRWGSNAEIKAMLQFSAEHGIKPVIERYAMADVNQALARLRINRVRYRAVLAQHA